MAGSGTPLRVHVAGLGLIGGSVALAARERLGAVVTGEDADDHVAREATEAGVTAAVADSAPDVVVVATPVPAIAATVATMLDRFPDAAVTDVGSTKSALAAAGFGSRYVGGHPMAGAEVSGLRHARADLFAGATWFLTPRLESDGVLLERLHRFVTGIGASPVVLDPDEHDRLMSAFSHLPHVIANVLAGRAVAALGGERRPMVGPSFRDATRVAGANPPLWAGIYEANRDALVADIDGVIADLRSARELIAGGATAEIESWQAAATEARTRLGELGVAAGASARVRAIVPNRPGVVAELTITLGRAGINIQDMSLQPAADNRSGQVTVWVDEDREDEARALVEAVAGSASS
ncbi:MAG: prephenate dehydrogenase/arogenate dehydrogenase family protein [Baekduia sp.]